MTTLVGFTDLLRLALRRDRVRIGLWFVGLVGLTLASTASIRGLYDTPEQLQQYAALVEDNTALIIQAGPGYGLESPTSGAVLMNELSLWMIIAVGLMNVFSVVRHTRTEEETERAELVRAAPVGRFAGTAAALADAAIGTVLVAVGTVATLVLYEYPLVGSVAFGAALVGAGAVFAGVATVSAQIASNSRTALGLGGVAIAVSFVLRAIGDVRWTVLTWLSPLGWAQGIRAFADERWWVLLLPICAATLLVAGALALQMRRDFGAGLVPQRPGRAHALPSFATPFSLAMRLQRGSLIGWSVGLAWLAFFYGIVADQADEFLEDNPEMEDFFAQLGDASITDAYLSTALLITALMACGFAISSVLRIRSEERAERADTVLATPTTRRSFAGGHSAIAAAGSVVLMATAGAMMGLGFALVSGDFGHVADELQGGLALAPALLVIVGAAVAICGLLPNYSWLSWGALVGVIAVGLFGNVLDLPQWARNLSPLEHAPALPAESWAVLPIVALLAVAAVLTTIGLAAFERRDIG